MNKNTTTYILFGGLFLIAIGIIAVVGCSSSRLPWGSDRGSSDISMNSDMSGGGDLSVPEDKIPAGWQVYQSQAERLAFAYPADWHVVEHESWGILLSDQEIDTSHGEVLDVPVIVGVEEEGFEELDKTLDELNPKVRQVNLGGKAWKVYSYAEPSGQRELYATQIDEEVLLEVGVNKDTIKGIDVNNLLSSISF